LHRQSAARTQRDLRIEQQRVTGEQVHPKTAHDHREHDRRFGEREHVADARARSAAERHVRVLVTRLFRARLEARVARMLAYVQEHRAFFAIANEHGLFAGAVAPSARASGRTLERMETFRGVFRAIVEEGIASGDLEPLDADALARFLGGTMRAFVLSSLAQDGADVREQATMTTDLFLYGASRRRKRSR